MNNEEKDELDNQDEEIKSSDNKRYLTGFVTGALTACVTVLVAGIIFVLVFGTDAFKKNQLGSMQVEDNKQIDKSMDTITSKIEYLAGLISTYYLEDVDTSDIVEGIYKGIFESIDDPYSVYYTADEFKTINEKTTGEFGGIGVKVTQNKDKQIIITDVLDDGGAKEAGIKKDDILTGVEGEDITDKDIDTVIALIKGDVGTDIKITVSRSDGDNVENLDFTVTRSVVESVTVYSKMLDDDIGYIYISTYGGKTGEQFKNQLLDLKSKGMKGLIIDERNNGGGLLTAVTEVADCLMGDGTLVTTKDKSGKVTSTVTTSDDNTILDVPLVILVNENSASASEVLAGAVKDRQIGKLVGTTTFGKGIVQSLLPLTDGSAIRITTERYYTPNGNYIHGTGIDPDYKIELDVNKAKDDGVDTQYEKAVSVIKEMMKNSK